MAPVAPLLEERAEEVWVDPAELVLGDVGFEDLGSHEEDVPELTDELEPLVEDGYAERRYGVLVCFEVSAGGCFWWQSVYEKLSVTIEQERTLPASSHRWH